MSCIQVQYEYELEDLSHVCVVIFWWLVDVSIKSEFEERYEWELLCVFGQAIPRPYRRWEERIIV